MITALESIRNLVSRSERTERKSVRDPFRLRQNIWNDVEVVNSPELAGSPVSSLNFVNDEGGVMRMCNLLDAFEPALWRDDNSTSPITGSTTIATRLSAVCVPMTRSM